MDARIGRVICLNALYISTHSVSMNLREEGAVMAPVTDKKASAELSNLNPETLLGSLEP